MCALYGWLDYGGIIQHRTLKKLLRVLSIESEVRGRDATGFAYIANGDIKVFKAPVSARKLHLYFPANTKCVMSHARMATNGAPENNQNNHPWVGTAGETKFALAHNGVLFNDKLLRISNKLPETPIECDSYIAVQLLEKSNALNFDSLKTMAETVEGTFTFSLIDDKNNLYIVKDSSPIFVAHFHKLGLYIYASTEAIFTKAILKTKLRHEPFSVVEVTNGDILKISAQGEIERAKFESFSPFYSNFKWSCYGSNFYKETDISHGTYLDELIELGSFAGVSKEEVTNLYNMGFSGYEIEELLQEPELLREHLCDINEEESGFSFEY